jgi:hypothetical protein
MDPGTSTEARYRYRFEGTTSNWISGDELQEAAQAGVFDETAEIQMSGHADWRLASSIRGLTFTSESEEVIEEALDDSSTPETEDRLTRFGTLRELMAAFVREEIELDHEKTGEYLRVNLCAISSDHFEIIDEDGLERTFIPLHRVRSIIAIDTGKNGTNYKENHLLRISLV